MRCHQCKQDKGREDFHTDRAVVCISCLRTPVKRKIHPRKCAICQESGPLVVYGNKAKQRKLHVSTLLCKMCNIGLEAFDDSPTLLAKAIELLTSGRDESIMVRAHLEAVGALSIHRSATSRDPERQSPPE